METREIIQTITVNGSLWSAIAADNSAIRWLCMHVVAVRPIKPRTSTHTRMATNCCVCRAKLMPPIKPIKPNFGLARLIPLGWLQFPEYCTSNYHNRNDETGHKNWSVLADHVYLGGVTRSRRVSLFDVFLFRTAHYPLTFEWCTSALEMSVCRVSRCRHDFADLPSHFSFCRSESVRCYCCGANCSAFAVA